MKKLMRLMLVLAAAVAFGVLAAACSRNANDPKALSDANVKGVHTSYDRDANVVHLQGTVDSVDQKERADQVAAGAVGTTGRVLDEIKVQGMDEKPAADQDALIRDTKPKNAGADRDKDKDRERR